MLDPTLILVEKLTPLLIDQAADLWKVLTKRVSEAKKEYQEKSPQDLVSEVEILRRKCLDNLSEIQARAILSLSNPALLQKILLILTELTARVYESQIEQDLDSLARQINQINSLLDRDEKERKNIRTLKLWGVLISTLVLIGLFVFAFFTPIIGINNSDVVPIIQIPITVLMWSSIGSFTALAYRFNKSGDTELGNPLRWLITRPLAGIVMGIIAYLLLKVGIVNLSPDKTISLATNELTWLLAFLAGFSDRFSESILKTAIGRLGGDGESSLFTYSDSSSGFNLTELLQSIIKPKKEKIESVSTPKDETENAKVKENNTPSNESSEATPKSA